MENPEKISKKQKKRKTLTDQQECVESLEVQKESESEKQHRKHKKKKKNKEMKDLDVQTTEKKKKKRKLNERVNVSTEETSQIDDGLTAEVRGATEDPPKKKKKKKKSKETRSDCEDEDARQESETSEQQHRTHEDVQESQHHSDIHFGFIKRRKTGQTGKDPTAEIDPKLLNDLKEFVPEIGNIYQSTVAKIIIYDLPRYKEFKKQGISLRHGRFSEEENMRLRENVRNFLALTGVENPTKLFHTRRFPDEKLELMKLKKLHRFYERIAEGIPRACNEVFARGRKVFDDENYKGRFTKDEIKALIKFQTIYGNNWQKISKLTGRSAYSLEKRFSQIATKSGPWSEKEVRRLLRAVRDHIVTTLKSESTNKRTPTRVPREMLYKRLPWFAIAEQVKTRCWNKCRDKWMTHLSVRMSSGTIYRGRKCLEGKIKLIKAMYEMQVDDVADVNWEDLTTVFGDIPPAHVQVKWHQLKVCYVPNYQTKCFGDIVDFLYEKILPGLEKDCEDLHDDVLKVDQQQSFRISDIFGDIKDNDEEENDDEEGNGQT